MAEDPRLRAAREEARRTAAEAVQSLQAMAAGLRKQHERFRADRDQRDASRARAAREGELGPEVQRIQQRIDLGQTTWDDVLQGRDDHSSAVAARQNVQRHLREVGEQLRHDPDFQEKDQAAREQQQRLRDEGI